MKNGFFLLQMILLVMFNRSSFYDLKFEAMDGTLIQASAFKGKKVVVAIVSANSPGLSMVRYLDSIQKNSPNIRAIAIPTGDFGGDVNIQGLRTLGRAINIIVTRPLKVSRSNGAQQHPLFAWLTQSTENGHFNMDAEGEGQVFVINENGTLYSVLSKEAPKAVIAKVITEPSMNAN